MRICPRCKENKPLTDYHKNRAKANGRHSYCKDCNAIRQKEWAAKNGPQRLILQRKYTLKKSYGITPEIYQELLDAQDGKCAICQKHHTEFKVRLAVEHCHKTGAIRGLCCTYCNRGLAVYHDKSEYFRRAADYLEQNTGYFVPEDRKKPKKRRRKKKK